MTEFWTVEEHDRTGTLVLRNEIATSEDIQKLVREALMNSQIGGIVIYRPTRKIDGSEGGDRNADQALGLVIDDASVAGGNGRQQPCKYCDEFDGHTADCPVIS